MVRLLVHVEGLTEETFVNDILEPHLCSHGYGKVDARQVGNSRQRERRGGIRAWSAVRKDILNHLKEDEGCLATMMVDYYGLPHSGAAAWPGRAAAGLVQFPRRAAVVEAALAADICEALREEAGWCRFAPFVVMHEFEGLLFSDCEAFSRGIGRSELAPALQSIRDAFATPEEINDSAATAPSKRVETLVPGYRKALFGTLAVQAIGLDAIRAECPHFRGWLERLEAWPGSRVGTQGN